MIVSFMLKVESARCSGDHLSDHQAATAWLRVINGMKMPSAEKIEAFKSKLVPFLKQLNRLNHEYEMNCE